MSAFRFPQPGERQNAAAIPVPVHTLRALLAAALAWEVDTNATVRGAIPLQVTDATNVAISRLSEEDAHTAAQTAEWLMQERADAEAKT